MTVTLYLDDDVFPAASDLLRDRGHSVVCASDVGNHGKRDRDHLFYCFQSGHTLVTFNASDFVYLHHVWQSLVSWGVLSLPHKGILTFSRQILLQDLCEVIGRLLQQNVTFDGILYTWVVAKESRWILDRF